MAILTLDVPNALVPDLASAIAARMLDAPDAALVAIATKITTGQVTTAAEKQALAEAWIKRDAKSALLDYRAQQASITARQNTTDPAVTW